jgi:glycosyltransferase involved in cell wall biosynthesis
MDVPTWHRNKGHVKPAETKSERELRLSDRGWRDWRKHLPATRLQFLAEYDLADVLLMPSTKSAETFLAAGVAPERLHYVGRGVDPQRYHPGTKPEIFRAVLVGALIKRKGVHHLLAAWKNLALKNAELVLVGSSHEEMKPYLDAVAGEKSVRLVGFTKSVEDELRNASVFVFPSECEGFAKATLEAAACGLPLIATRESGDAIVDGETGWVIPANNADALAAALQHAQQNQDALAEMGARARQRVELFFTWDHYRTRLLHGYAKAMALR